MNIQGYDTETLDSFKYLGVHLNNNQDWSHNTDALYRRGQSCLLLRRLRSFGDCTSLLETFYDSVVACHLLGSRRLQPGQEETEQADQGGQICPGLPAGLCGGGGGEEDVSQDDIHYQ